MAHSAAASEAGGDVVQMRIQAAGVDKILRAPVGLEPRIRESDARPRRSLPRSSCRARVPSVARAAPRGARGPDRGPRRCARRRDAPPASSAAPTPCGRADRGPSAGRRPARWPTAKLPVTMRSMTPERDSPPRFECRIRYASSHGTPARSKRLARCNESRSGWYLVELIARALVARYLRHGGGRQQLHEQDGIGRPVSLARSTRGSGRSLLVQGHHRRRLRVGLRRSRGAQSNAMVAAAAVGFLIPVETEDEWLLQPRDAAALGSAPRSRTVCRSQRWPWRGSAPAESSVD